MRALVLAAGRGVRLRPLTDSLPKPLLPVLGESILERTLRRLAAAGVEAVAINLHHLGEQIEAALGDSLDGMPLGYWPEERLLGTLGPLGRLHEFFAAAADPILLVNGDSLCRWPVDALVRAHRASDAEATLLLTSYADVESFGGGVVLDEDGRVLSFRGGEGERRGVFAGFHVIEPGLVRGVEARPSDIVRDLYEPALERGASIRGVFTRRRWHDLGTPGRYLSGVLDEASGLADLASCAPEPSLVGGVPTAGGWLHRTARVHREAEVVSSVVEAGVVIEPGASVEGSLLMPDSVVEAGGRVRGSIVGPGVRVAPSGPATAELLVATDGERVAVPL